MHTRCGDARAEATHHGGRAGSGTAPAPQAHDVLRSCGKRGRRRPRGCVSRDTRRDAGDEQRVGLIGDVLHGNDLHHDDALFILDVFQHRVVVAVHRVGEFR
jgi:hypothetical protein